MDNCATFVSFGSVVRSEVCPAVCKVTEQESKGKMILSPSSSTVQFVGMKFALFSLLEIQIYANCQKCLAI